MHKVRAFIKETEEILIDSTIPREIRGESLRSIT